MIRFGLPTILAGLLLPATALAAAAAPEAAATAARPFAIPAQPMANALIVFGRQANVQVLTAAGMVDKLRSADVSGKLAPAQALARLLAGSGLGYAFLDANTVVVKPGVRGKADGKAPAPIDIHQLAPVTTIGVIDANGYLVDVASGGTRLAISPMELPASVSEVSRDLLDSQQAHTVADALRNVAGVLSLDGVDALPVFLVRDFQVGNGMIDGLPNSLASYGALPPLIGVERVEVLKGPQAIVGDMSYSNNFGGLVNLVLKQPTALPVHRLDLELGQYGDTRLGLDLGGALDKDQHWTYRLVGSVDQANRSRQGRIGQRGVYFAPSLGWRNATNRLVLSVQQLSRRDPIPDYAVMPAGTLASTTPAGLLLGHASDHSLFRSTRASYSYEHRWNATWRLRSRGQYVRQDSRVKTWTLVDMAPNGDALPLAESYRYGDAFYTLQNDLVAHFDGSVIGQTVVAGFDYSRSLSGRVDDIVSLYGLSGYNIFSSPPLPRASTVAGKPPGVDFYALGDPWTNEHGLFLQDQFALGERWNALLAVRRATYALGIQNADGQVRYMHQSQWVPNAGLLYKPTPSLSLYASATNGFQPGTVLGKDGVPLMPSKSRQLEAGAKLMLFDQRAMLTLAAYRIMLDHRTSLSSPRPPYYGLPGPGQTNQGAELEFNGQLTRDLDLSLAYTHANVRNHDGSLPIGAPKQRFNLWASYRLDHGAWRGWGVAGGVLARSASRGLLTDGTTYFGIPGQARVDLSVFRQAAHWRLTLGVRNLFDRELRDAEFNETFVPLHRGREVLLSARYDF